MDRVPSGVEPMITNLESYIVNTGLDDMKAAADIITTVSGKCKKESVLLPLWSHARHK